MRLVRLGAAVAAAAFAAGVVAGCSDGTSAQSGQSDSQSLSAGPAVDRDPSFAIPEVSGAFGEVPEITPVEGPVPDALVSKVLEETDPEGEVIEPDDTVYVNYSGVLWDGSAFDSTFDRGSASTFSLNSVIEGWKYGLSGTRVGDRVELVVPPQYGYGDEEQTLIPAGSTLVFVVDVMGVADTSELENATPTGNAIPEGMLVEGDLGQPPRVVFEEGGEAPSEEVSVVLAEGSGPVITASDTVVYHYVGTYWGTSQAAATTWESGPEMIEAGQSLFLGEKVGSRLAMVFPGDGETQPAMVMIVDIVAAFGS